MRPMDEQKQFDELNANRRVKLAPNKVFEASLNDSYDPIRNAMRRPLILRKRLQKRWQTHLGFKKKGAYCPFFI